MTLVLIGYMGSGKSVIGQSLANTLQLDYLDLDDYIQSKENKSISEIFRSNGEIYFRKKESEYLHQILSKENAVISLGGGTPCYAKNMGAVLDSKTTSIYLRATVKTLSDRLFTERRKRPLIAHLQTEEELLEFVGKHLFERSNFYEQCHYTVDTNGKSVESVVDEIKTVLG